jgi:hypothetical protein
MPVATGMAARIGRKLGEILQICKEKEFSIFDFRFSIGKKPDEEEFS